MFHRSHKVRVAAHAFTWVARIGLTFAAVTASFNWISKPSSGLVALALGVLIITALCWWVWFYDHVLPLFGLGGEGPSKEDKKVKAEGKGRLGMVLLLAGLLALVGCTRIDPGYVGIKVNLYGSQRGVEDFPLVTGMVFYNPFATSVYEWPTFVQTAVWTRSLHEGRAVNEEISFNSKEGMIFTADISLGYSLDPKKVPHFYVKFRSDKLDAFTHGFFRNIARDYFNEVATHYTAEEIYGDKKETFINEVKKRLNDNMSAYGVIIEQFGFIGAPRPPDPVRLAIDAKIKAIQDAIRTENEVRQAQAEAKKTIARAEGEARANVVLSASLSSPLIEWQKLRLTEQAIARWDGKRPMIEGQGPGGLLFAVSPQDARK